MRAGRFAIVGRAMKDADTAGVGPEQPAGGDADCLARGEVVGRYVIQRRIGTGGMGVVYMAFDPELDRPVAIKLLRADLAEGPGARSRRLRLVREAQAQARLSHENLVTVLDVGTARGRVFVAMEYVDGTTLRGWLDQAPRTWRQILRVFTAAGNGLAAAHRGGLIHRDFKPENVLVSRNGDVRVTDFGLARAIDTVEDEPDPSSSLSGEDSLAAALTRTGALLGTPYYMAPEQHRRGPTDQRTDQFSFCVALYEALYHQHPFGGGDAQQIAANVLGGRVREPPRGARVPGWVRADLGRGLALDPDDRYPTIDALLASLQRDRSAARRRKLAGTAAVVGLAVLAVVGQQRFGGSDSPNDACRDAGAPVHAVWNDDARSAVRSDAAAAALDRFAAAWAAMRVDACEAMRLRGDQSTELHDQRVACLDARLAEAAAVIARLRDGGDLAAARAETATGAMRPIDACADVDVLMQLAPLPTGDTQRSRAAALRVDIARARAARHTGDAPSALAIAGGAVDAAVALGYRPAVAEARYERARALEDTGDPAAAETDLHDAVIDAKASGHLALEADAWIDLVDVVGVRQRRYADGARWARHADAVVERLGRDSEHETRLAGAVDQLVAELERDVAGATPGDAAGTARTRLTLAHVLWDTRRDRPRARQLGETARGELEAAGATADVKAAEAWLASISGSAPR
jgi:hypothetical protein